MRKIVCLKIGVIIFIILIGIVYVKNECMLEKQHIEITNAYESFLDFPYESMRYVDETAIKFIQEIYLDIDFKSNFAEEDNDSWDYYKEKFKQLLLGELPFLDVETGEEIYLPKYKPILMYDGKKYTFDVCEYLYVFFDMDEDGTPELCLLNGAESMPTITDIYIFKYDKETDTITVWRKENSSYYYIFGSKKMGWDWQGGIRRGFYQLNEDGKDEMVLFFVESSANGVPVYMVTLPRYADSSKQENIPEEVKKQLYYDCGSQLYYFRVTKEQYYELAKDFLREQESAKERLNELITTYDELFTVN